MEYHQDRFDDYSLLVFHERKLVALLPANISKNEVYSHQGLSYGGLVVAAHAKFDDILGYFKVVLEYLQNHSIESLHVKMLPSIYTSHPSGGLDYLMFKLEATLVRRDVLSVIDYQQANRAISSNRKRGLKRAKGHNLVIKEETTFDAFWKEILIPNLKESYNVSPVHTLEEISFLGALLPNNIRQFNVYNNGNIVGGTTIFETNTVAHAQYISANSSRQELGTLDFLFDYLINEVYKEKAYFDFGTSNINQGQQFNHGLLAWKESFGARSITQDFYTVKTKNVNRLNNLML